LKVLLIRAILGVILSTLVIKFLFPGSGVLTILILAALLILSAYGFEQIHRGTKP
jgi:hypothetical protein